jgi:SAM-dependent methyltransferase
MNEAGRVLYRQSRFPVLQNRLFASREAALDCATGDILLVQDCSTGLIRNAGFEPSLITYDSTYHNEQEYSQVFKHHLDVVGDLVEQQLGTARLAEIGCGKGYFLELLASRGCSIAGYDPTYEGINPRVQKSFVDPSTSLQAAGIIVRHVLEHVPAPVAFLHELRAANNGAGRIYIEVPCFDWILENRAWFDIFYEHVNYFRLEDFDRLFDRVVHSGRLFGGQYLYCVAELGSLRGSLRAGWTLSSLPDDFLPPEITQPPSTAASDSIKEAVWGCASKGVIFSLLRARAGRPLDVAIDINPNKHGMYLPGSGLGVSPPESGLAQLPPGSTIFVMNTMYAKEIEAIGGSDYNYVILPRPLYRQG